jgi:hypothetical protein
MDINQELDEKFQTLDSESKLMVALLAFSQCACGHRRFLGLGQMKHAHDYIVTEDAMDTAEAVNPEVVGKIEVLRQHLEQVSAEPTDYYGEDLAPKGNVMSREFLWGDGFEQPVWFDIRHVSREGLTALESVLAPKPGPPGPPPGAPSDG